jgi:hypothetical protein
MPDANLIVAKGTRKRVPAVGEVRMEYVPGEAIT